MTTHKVSIIIPVHNSEKKLQFVVAGIQSQDYENWELILVENGSSDDSAKICKQLAEGDSRIKATESKLSTSIARRAGIMTATGEYIIFSDADDSYIDNHAIGRMVQSIVENECDIVQFGHYNQILWKRERIAQKESMKINRDELLNRYMGGY